MDRPGTSQRTRVTWDTFVWMWWWCLLLYNVYQLPQVKCTEQITHTYNATYNTCDKPPPGLVNAHRNPSGTGYKQARITPTTDPVDYLRDDSYVLWPDCYERCGNHPITDRNQVLSTGLLPLLEAWLRANTKTIMGKTTTNKNAEYQGGDRMLRNVAAGRMERFDGRCYVSETAYNTDTQLKHSEEYRTTSSWYSTPDASGCECTYVVGANTKAQSPSAPGGAGQHYRGLYFNNVRNHEFALTTQSITDFTNVCNISNFPGLHYHLDIEKFSNEYFQSRCSEHGVPYISRTPFKFSDLVNHSLPSKRVLPIPSLRPRVKGFGASFGDGYWWIANYSTDGTTSADLSKLELYKNDTDMYDRFRQTSMFVEIPVQCTCYRATDTGAEDGVAVAGWYGSDCGVGCMFPEGAKVTERNRRGGTCPTALATRDVRCHMDQYSRGGNNFVFGERTPLITIPYTPRQTLDCKKQMLIYGSVGEECRGHTNVLSFGATTLGEERAHESVYALIYDEEMNVEGFRLGKCRCDPVIPMQDGVDEFINNPVPKVAVPFKVTGSSSSLNTSHSVVAIRYHPSPYRWATRQTKPTWNWPHVTIQLHDRSAVCPALCVQTQPGIKNSLGWNWPLRSEYRLEITDRSAVPHWVDPTRQTNVHMERTAVTNRCFCGLGFADDPRIPEFIRSEEMLGLWIEHGYNYGQPKLEVDQEPERFGEAPTVPVLGQPGFAALRMCAFDLRSKVHPTDKVRHGACGWKMAPWQHDYPDGSCGIDVYGEDRVGMCCGGIAQGTCGLIGWVPEGEGGVPATPGIYARYGCRCSVGKYWNALTSDALPCALPVATASHPVVAAPSRPSGRPGTRSTVPTWTIRRVLGPHQ
jgi:hypothetical protein